MGGIQVRDGTVKSVFMSLRIVRWHETHPQGGMKSPTWFLKEMFQFLLSLLQEFQDILGTLFSLLKDLLRVFYILDF